MSDEGPKKWRCAWCDKPHARNDPPCDNCGHHKFEKAVVPAAPEHPDHEPEPVWVCPECGRQHQKNSPPCSRCGNPSLEKRSPEAFDEAELDTPSYVDLLEPRYVAGFAIALVGGVVLLLALLGVITLPGMGGGSLDVADVPGNATTAGGVSLSETEQAFVDALNDRRSGADGAELERAERLDDVAAYVNQWWVKTYYQDAEMPDGERVQRALSESCDRDPVWFRVSRDEEMAAADSPEALASALIDGDPDRAQQFEGSELGRVGVDVHAGPDGRAFATAVAC